MNEMKIKAKKTRNELKVSNSKTYTLKNEERMKNGKERRKTFTDLLTETSWKRYGSTSAWIFFTETIFFTQNSWNELRGGWAIFGTTPFRLFIGKMGRTLPPISPRRVGLLPPEATLLRKYSGRVQIRKFENFYLHPLLISSPPSFIILRKSYGSFTEAYRTWLSSFFLFLLTHIKWNMFI